MKKFINTLLFALILGKAVLAQGTSLIDSNSAIALGFIIILIVALAVYASKR